MDTSYHQMKFAPLDVDGDASLAADSLAVVDGLALIVIVGVRDGKVKIDITTDPERGFDAEEEVTLSMTIEESLTLTSPTVMDSYDDVFTPTRPGPHHVRVRARGRHDHYDESVAGKKPVEFYQLTIWPA